MDKGTFCAVIEKQIATPVCPLPDGHCMWKHRQSGRCTYVEDQPALSPNEYAAKVGLPQIDGALVNILKSSLIQRVKDELQD